MDLNEQECIELDKNGKVDQTFVEFLHRIMQQQQIEHEAIEQMHIRAHIRVNA